MLAEKAVEKDVGNDDILLFFNALYNCPYHLNDQIMDKLINKAKINLTQIPTANLCLLLREVTHAHPSSLSKAVKETLEDKIMKEISVRDVD